MTRRRVVLTAIRRSALALIVAAFAAISPISAADLGRRTSRPPRRRAVEGAVAVAAGSGDASKSDRRAAVVIAASLTAAAFAATAFTTAFTTAFAVAVAVAVAFAAALLGGARHGALLRAIPRARAMPPLPRRADVDGAGRRHRAGRRDGRAAGSAT